MAARHDPASSLAEALADLQRLTATRPELISPGRQLGRILEAAFAEPSRVSPALDDRSDQAMFLVERAIEGWNEGVPAVRVLAPSFDPGSLQRRLAAIASCLNPNADDKPSLCHQLQDPKTLSSCATAFLSGGADGLSDRLAAAGIQPASVLPAVRLALLGELGPWTSALTDAIGQSTWSSGACPVCTAPPALAEARGLEQRRFLRCGWCAAGWPAARGQCPFCGEADARALRYLAVEEDRERYRLVLCDTCGGRLKVLATLAPISPPGLVVADLATVHLDFLEADDHNSSD